MLKTQLMARDTRWPSLRLRWLQCAAASVVLLMIFFLFRRDNDRWALTSSNLYRGGSYTKKETDQLLFNTETLLPHIPPKIWQVSILPGASGSHDPVDPPKYATQWLSFHPSFAYSIVNAAGAFATINRIEEFLPLACHSSDRSNAPARRRAQLDQCQKLAEPTRLYNAVAQPVVQADLVRYALLALEGGVYSDSDTYPVRPLRDWVPEVYRNQTRLIVGIEADSQPPVNGTKYPVQLGQWTFAAAKNHPILWRMIRRVLEEVQRRAGGTESVDEQQPDVWFNIGEVLSVSGPVGWTEELYRYLSDLTATEFTWGNLTGLTGPVLFGDVLVLPINGFTTGVEHSGASMETVEATMVRHDFAGSWKNQP
ncbi:initiation-specific alpha-mannosyltransferase [Colletotrichum plurivorum]|uniref:Initiation-specific alpha-mannosyltransferase n=1 Tax=Colletotrichum plurivorum TaxID=2175906 RepID=A0A8H6N7L8_9PEZI|nr:initiation-specific alpha-mannosyltransferase [Colletotrichum plurivorum]